jgi:hypothetical protein
MKKLLAISVLALAATLPAAATIDGTGPNTWISVGVPIRLHIGSTGDFYLEGNDHGRCNNVRPDYFRFDMSQPHFKDVYAALLVASTNGMAVDCVVDSACGTSQVWLHYCRIPIR